MNPLIATVAALFSGIALLLATRGQTFSRVDAGGPTLRLLVAGAGSPTVVFESGAGGPLETWVRVQPAVGRFAKTISYDRAGNGLSDQGPVPRDGRHVAAELHAALHHAHLPPPYVLVGHSLGGPFIRVFAGRYPEEVAGLVLVDPTQEELVAWAKAREPKPDKPAHEPRPSDEVDCAPATFAQASQSPVPSGIPVVLITGMGPKEIPGFLPPELRKEVAKDQTVFYPAKLKLHRAWVEKIPGGKLVVAGNSGHGIPFEEPELVVKTIRNLVDQARIALPATR